MNPPFTAKVGEPGSKIHMITFLLRKWAVLCKSSELPTRAILLIPETTDGDGDQFIKEAKALNGICFFSIANDVCKFISPSWFRKRFSGNPGAYRGKVHFVLFQNEIASKLDFIDTLKRDGGLGCFSSL